jgi:hypothetical protein
VAKEGKAMRNKLMRTSLLTPVLLTLLFVAGSSVSGQQFDKLSNLTLEADNPDYTGPCPNDIRLTGKFQVNEASLGLVYYQVIGADTDGGGALTLSDKGVRTVDVRFTQTGDRPEWRWHLSPDPSLLHQPKYTDNADYNLFTDL